MNNFKGSARIFVHSSLSSARSPKNTFLVPLEVTDKVILCWPEPAFACVTGSCGKCHMSVKPLGTKHWYTKPFWLAFYTVTMNIKIHMHKKLQFPSRSQFKSLDNFLLWYVITNYKSGGSILFNKMFYFALWNSDFFGLVDHMCPGAQSSYSF